MKTFKTTIALAVICLLATVSSVAQENSLLYKVEGNGIKTSYVFGTFHMLPKADFILKDKVKNAFDASDLVVMELDMDDPNMQTEMMGVSMIETEDSLQNHMTAEEYKILDDYFTAKIGVGMANFNKMKPFVVSSMVMMAHLGKDMASYEATLVAMAKEGSKDLKGLETVAFQMSMFDGQSYEDQIDDVIKMLTNDGGIGGYFDKMLAVYKTEDVEGLYNSMDEFFEHDKAMQEKLLDERNQNWIPKIGEYSKEQKVFYAVGAGHLGGKQGVVKLLKKAGYTVTPVTE
ncbi:hypothetical protein SCB49_06572 [unidentified eubacterium SCB49]|nr:hypothetical protein SCB49_06572 [unidentified eubacterium SCB49]